MPKVKLFWVMDSYENEAAIASGASDWEDITDEEMKFLEMNRYRLPRKSGMYLTIVMQNDTPIIEYIESIKNLIAVEQAKLAEKSRINKAKAEERKRVKNQSKEEKELEDYKKLKAKFEGKQ